MSYTTRDAIDAIMGALEIGADLDDPRDCADLATDEIERLRAIESAARMLTYAGATPDGWMLVGPKGYESLAAALKRKPLEVTPSDEDIDLAIVEPVIARKQLCVAALAGIPDAALQRAVSNIGDAARLSVLFATITEVLIKTAEG